MNKAGSEIEAIQAQARLGYQDPSISRIFSSYVYGLTHELPAVLSVFSGLQAVIVAATDFAALFLKVDILWVVVMGTAVSAFVF